MDLIFILSVGLFLVIALILYAVLRKLQSVENASQNSEHVIRLQQNIELLAKSVHEQRQMFFNQLNSVTSQINDRLKENATYLHESQKVVGERLEGTSKAYATVTAKLSQLEEANKRIYEVGKDIASLQEILRSPKLRGSLGELFLGDLLGQILPQNHYALQHSFKNKETVDAIIRLKDGVLIPIDAKFPLENFKKMIEATPEEQRAHRKVFLKDVKNRIEEIATKYILPDEGTLDFALMYIPAENVYYELIIKDEEGEGILQHALSRRVIPVSPNSFYSYLQTILLGLKGMQIESSAKEILLNLARLKGDFEKFSDQFRLLGGHLTHAQKTYTESEKKLEKFENKLEVAGSAQSTILIDTPEKTLTE